LQNCTHLLNTSAGPSEPVSSMHGRIGYFSFFKSCSTSLIGVSPVAPFHGRPEIFLPVLQVYVRDASTILADVCYWIKPARDKVADIQMDLQVWRHSR
jgi:hypothetical protein